MERVIYYVLLSPIFLSILNLFLYFLGFENPLDLYVVIADSKMASLIGINTQRVLYPISNGINHFGIIAGLALTISLFIFKYIAYGKSKLAVLISVFLLLTVLILADSKTALIMPLLVFLLLYTLDKLGQLSKVKWIPFLVPLMPLILLIALQYIATTDLADLISRRPGDIESATGRNIIWGFLLNGLNNFNLTDLVGYGQYGHITYGITEQWESFFSRNTDTATMSGHNLTFQLIYDIGYFGFIIFLFLNYQILRILIKFRHKIRVNYALIGALVYLLVIGTTESSISLYFKENLILYIFIVMYSMILSYNFNPKTGNVIFK